MNLFLKLMPYLQPAIWGSARWGKGPIGESWVISNNPNGSSRVGDRLLGDLIKEIPYLIKFIDTVDNLSIQVHPGDEFAKKFENSLGKTECWLILSAKPGAGIFLGLKTGVSENEFREAIHQNRDLSNLLNFFPVRRGDFFFVPSGTPHAIGRNVFLVEVQQNSGITYRIWDWNRLGLDGKPRELHIEKALQVINFKENLYYKKESVFDCYGETLLLENRYFDLRLFRLKKNQQIAVNLSYNKVAGMVCLEGLVGISHESQKEDLSSMEAMVATTSSEVSLIAREDSLLIWVN